MDNEYDLQSDAPLDPANDPQEPVNPEPDIPEPSIPLPSPERPDPYPVADPIPKPNPEPFPTPPEPIPQFPPDVVF